VVWGRQGTEGKDVGLCDNVHRIGTSEMNALSVEVRAL
jgi:hypothetical protein